MQCTIAFWNACDSGNTIKNRRLGTFLAYPLNYSAGKLGVRQHLIEELASSSASDQCVALPMTHPTLADHYIPLLSYHTGILADIEALFNDTWLSLQFAKMNLGLQFFEAGVINNNAVNVISKNFLSLLTFEPVIII